MNTKTEDKSRLPETVDHVKESERLWALDDKLRQNQGSKEGAVAAAAPAADYESKTVPELKELAEKRGVEIHSDMRKDDIIAALEKG